MTSVVKPDERLVGRFSDRETAEAAMRVLQAAGFTRDQFSLVAESPTIPETKAKESGIKGAIVGALFGALVGLTLSYLKLNVVGGAMDVDATTNLVGMSLAGSLVGAAGLGLIAAMTGVNVRQDKADTAAATAPDFLLLAKELSAEQLTQAQATLQQKGVG
jgi:hypothetical protein